MRYCYSILLFVFIIISNTSFSQETKSVHEQLIELNKYWEKFDCNYPELDERIQLENDVSLIQMHLTLVIRKLRESSRSLSLEQSNNRKYCLDILEEYCDKGEFPKNLYHIKRTPYFIDDFGTACAVGQLIIKTGNHELAEKISLENNYAFIEDLSYTQLFQWAEENGFLLEELKWIQPAYQNCTTSCAPNTKKDVSCYGGNDGCIGMPPISFTNPPYYFSWYYYYAGDWNYWNSFGEACDLYAGDYKCSVYDGNGNLEEFYYTISQPDSIPSDTAITSCGPYLAPNNQYYNSSGPITLLACGSNSYTIDLTVLPSSSSNLTVDECHSYTAPDGQIYNTSGVYTVILDNSVGCDSVIIINLNIINDNLSIIQNGDTLQAAISSASYQWLNCENGFLPLANDTNQIFVPDSSGNYSVIVSQMGCVDTSSCYNFVLQSSAAFSGENLSNFSFSVYPNPSNGTFQIDLKRKGDYCITVYDLLGKISYSNFFFGDHLEINLQEEKGVYLIQVSDLNGNISYGRLVVE